MSMSDNAVKSLPAFGEGLTFIEQLHALSLQLCPNPKVPYLTGIKGEYAYQFRGSCDMWSCPVCGAKNGRKWLARLLNHMNHHSKRDRWYFCTITAHEKWRGIVASRKNIQQGWKKLYNRMRRRYGISEYAKVWEFHEDGSFHLHFLIGRKIGKRWLKNNARECGMGYIVDSSRSKNPGQCAGYAAKYLLKSFENSDKYLKGMRRIECSRNWTKLPEIQSHAEKWIVHTTRAGQDNTCKKMKQLGKVTYVIDRRPQDEVVNAILDAT